MPKIPALYYAYTKKSIRGPFPPRDITQLPGFSKSTLVCPENAIGQWREAAVEDVFQSCFEAPQPPAPAPKVKAPFSIEQAEGLAIRSLLEKGIAKNADLENELRALRREYADEKKHFEDETRAKDAEIKSLVDKLKRSTEALHGISREHPSWEVLYKTLKKNSEEKLFAATQALSEKTGENDRLQKQLQELRDGHEAAKRRITQDEESKKSAIAAQIADLKSQLEEKEMVVLTLSDNMSSLLAKNEEFQRIMLDERRDYEAQSKKFCEEIGALRSELSWKNQESEKINQELGDTLRRLNELEAVESIKTRQQEELYGVIHSKLKILTGYFENLESRVKYIFTKA